MRAAHLILATWVLFAHGTPIQKGRLHGRHADARPSGLKEGQQLLSPCPDLIDPTTGNTALYFYRGITPEQRRSTLFIHDHWGLSGCCNSQLHDACPTPPDPQPSFSPCPGLTTESGRMLFFYLNPYTTDQIASDYYILDAATNHKCSPSKERAGGSVSSSPTLNTNLQASNVQSPGTLPSNLNLPLANDLAPKNPAFRYGTDTDALAADTNDGYQDFGLKT